MPASVPKNVTIDENNIFNYQNHGDGKLNKALSTAKMCIFPIKNHNFWRQETDLSKNLSSG